MTEKPKKQTKKNLHEGHRERVRENDGDLRHYEGALPFRDRSASL